MVSTGQPQAAATPNPAILATAESEAPAPRISWIWHLLNFSPVLLLVWFVSRFSVKIPLLDEWWLSYLLHAVRLGTATFNDFFAQHNEHRLFFPRLIWTSLAFATGWNIKAELALNVLLVVIVFAVVYQIALRQAQRTGSALFNLANLSSSLFIFSLTQYETWLLGVMGAVLLVHASVALAIGVCFIQRLPPWTRFIVAAFFCFIASFSMMQGLASWIALLPCITLLPKEGRSGRKLYLWCFLFASSVVIYFYHFKFSPGRDILRFLHHPLQAGGFFVALMGNSFCQSDAIVSGPIALVAGAAVLLGLGAYLTMLRSESKEIIAPWLALALFGLFYAAMVTVGRSEEGIAGAMQSRYSSGTVLVSVAVIQLGRLVYVRKGARPYFFLLGALWALILAGSIRALDVAHHIKEDLSHAKLFVELIRYIDPATDASRESLLFPLYPGEGQTGAIRPMAEFMNELHFLPLASNVAFVDQPSPDYGLLESADESGDLSHLRRRKDQVTISGWATLPGGRGLPRMVLISYGDQKTFITGAVVGWVDRPDMAALRHDPRLFHSGWTVTFPARFLPPGDGILKAWVYDSAEKKFVRLPAWDGEKRFKIETP